MDPFDLRDWNGFSAAGGNASFPSITDQIVIDSRRIASKNALFVALEGNVEDGHCFIIQAIRAGARFILAKKGWFSTEPLGEATLLLVDNPLVALQQIAGCYRRQMPCKVVAIVGSYGKTMVKDLLKEMLKSTFSVAASPESFNSQIGVPLSLLTIRKEHKIALIEAAISKKNEMDVLSEIIGADFCVVTHIGKKHLPTLGGDLKFVGMEIMKIVKAQSKKQWALIPKDPLATIHLDPFKSDYYFWNEKSTSLPHAKYISEEHAEQIPYQLDFPDGKYFSGQIHSGFYYFLDLVNITAKAAWLLGTSSESISNALLHYTPEPMRTELWKSPFGALFINDTYCSDPQSIDKALKYMHQFAQGRRIFLFGGMRGISTHADIDYKRIGKSIFEAKIEFLLLFGTHPFLPLIEEIKRLYCGALNSYTLHCVKSSGFERSQTGSYCNINPFASVEPRELSSSAKRKNSIPRSIAPQIKIIQCASYQEALDVLKSSINPEATVQDNKVRQDFKLESFSMGADHSRMIKTTPIETDYDSKDCVNLLSSTAVFRFKQGDTILIKGEQKYSLECLTESFNDSISTNQCMINLAAIADNIQTIRHKINLETAISRINSTVRCMIMVKALAYGTDEVLIAKFLEACNIDILGVSYADEGIALKRAGVLQAIFVINAAAYEAEKIVKWEMEIGVSDKSLIDAISKEAEKQKKKIKVHLHINTGMNRFGCKPEEALPLAQLIANSPFLQLEGIMTHFACADDPAQDAFTHEQANRFDLAIEELNRNGINPPWRHAANSSGCIRFNFPQYNMVRIGLAVYGLYSSRAAKEALELRLAFSLISRIVGINICKKGETISYGRSYAVHREIQKIAVLPIGYFDGLHRNYSGKGAVIIRGRKAGMVGKICMDFMMVDVTDIPKTAPGDQVLIFGEDEYGNFLSPEELASQGDSIIHELITCLGPRIQRVFIFEEAKRQH